MSALRDRILRFADICEPNYPEEEIEFIRNCDDLNWYNTVFPYPWVNTFINMELPIEGRSENLVGVRIPALDTIVQFPSSYTDEEARMAMRLLLIEQYKESPHKYRRVKQNTTVIDIGSSEGWFGMLYCHSNNIIHMYDEEIWMKPSIKNLEEGNVVFHSELFTKDTDIDWMLDISDLKPLSTIKIDVEGAGIEVLERLGPVLKVKYPQIQAAVYHYPEEFNRTASLLKSLGYNKFYTNPGFIFYDAVEPRAPYWRRAMLFAEKE